MTQASDEIGFAPYQLYHAQITLMEDFAHQSKFGYKIAQSYLGDSLAPDGPADDPFGRTRAALFRYAFLLEWSFFEVFLKNTARELLRRHPSRIAAAGADQRLSYADLLRETDNLTSLAGLEASMIAQVIAAQQAGGSAQGLLGFIKQAFHLRSDPYEVSYSYKGQTRTVSRRDIAEIQAVRDALVDDGALAHQEIIERYPQVANQNGTVLVSEDYYMRAKSILNAVAFSLAQSIDNHWYDPS